MRRNVLLHGIVGLVYLILSITSPAHAQEAYQIRLEKDGDDVSEVVQNDDQQSEDTEQDPNMDNQAERKLDVQEQDIAEKPDEADQNLDTQEQEVEEKTETIEKDKVLPRSKLHKDGRKTDGFLLDGDDYLHSTNWKSFYEKWVAGHFAIGIRRTDYEFDRAKESGEDDEYFIGSIDTLKEEDPGFGLQNINILWFPLADSGEWVSESTRDTWQLLFAIIEGMGVELTWDHLRAKTWTSFPEEIPRAYSDGTIVAKGIMLSVVFNIKNPTPITPYFGFGTADYNDLSVTKGWWHYGFGGSNYEESYQQWRATGSPEDPNNGYRRTFIVDSSTGSFWYLGAKIDIYKNWSLDFFYRETKVEFDNTYTLSFGDTVVRTQYSKWDLSNKTYGIGVRYDF